jgi:hypothetical protein
MAYGRNMDGSYDAEQVRDANQRAAQLQVDYSAMSDELKRTKTILGHVYDRVEALESTVQELSVKVESLIAQPKH